MLNQEIYNSVFIEPLAPFVPYQTIESLGRVCGPYIRINYNTILFSWPHWYKIIKLNEFTQLRENLTYWHKNEKLIGNLDLEALKKYSSNSFLETLTKWFKINRLTRFTGKSRQNRLPGSWNVLSGIFLWILWKIYRGVRYKVQEGARYKVQEGVLYKVQWVKTACTL